MAGLSSTSNDVWLHVRFRPQSDLETKRGGFPIARLDSQGKCVVLQASGDRDLKELGFTFDRVFGPESSQECVYREVAEPIVKGLLQGYNGTIFAYGQTSGGKTYTMEGSMDRLDGRGLTPRVVQAVFRFVESSPGSFVKVSFFEIHKEKIFDLLSDKKRKLEVHEDKFHAVHVRDESDGDISLQMNTFDEVMHSLKAGAQRRESAATRMNVLSSRSHAVFILELVQKDAATGASKRSKMCLVDLAGSENVVKSGAQGLRMEEARLINKSLLQLNLVIRKLTSEQPGENQHIPYRDSKLTRILQDSLGGNCRTSIVICCSPSSVNKEETLNSLHFGMRAKKIKNCAMVNNVRDTPEELRSLVDTLTAENMSLKHALAEAHDELSAWRSGSMPESNLFPVAKLLQQRERVSSEICPALRFGLAEGLLDMLRHREAEIEFLKKLPSGGRNSLPADFSDLFRLKCLEKEMKAAFSELEEKLKESESQRLRLEKLCCDLKSSLVNENQSAVSIHQSPLVSKSLSPSKKTMVPAPLSPPDSALGSPDHSFDHTSSTRLRIPLRSSRSAEPLRPVVPSLRPVIPSKNSTVSRSNSSPLMRSSSRLYQQGMATKNASTHTSAKKP